MDTGHDDVEKVDRLTRMFDFSRFSPPPPHFTTMTASRPRTKGYLSLVLGLMGLYWAFTSDFLGTRTCDTCLDTTELCPQAPPLFPEENAALWQELFDTFKSEGFVFRAVDWLAGAVRIPTVSFDDMLPVGQDERWEVFGSFHEYLAEAFPKVHGILELAKVNSFGLVYVWKGSDPSLKPLLLTAHQDVVPVNSESYDQWVHPPFSGHFDGKSVWGRGSRDDKNGLIGLMAAIELLLEHGFKPAREIVLAFGIDEESAGTEGARQMGCHLLSVYGQNAFAFIVDEGGEISEEYGAIIANPSVAEKGYIDIQLAVTSPGGHSSVPPRHTTIGILAALLVQYEANPIPATLSRGSPMYQKVQCLAAHAPDIPLSLRETIAKSATSDKALRAAQDALFKDPEFEAYVGTTQAIDIVSGGMKTNALPENAAALVNHRISTESSVDDVKKHTINVLKPLTVDFNLSYTAFGLDISLDISGTDKPTYGELVLSDPFDSALEPAPVTPSGSDATSFQLLAGTIRTTWESSSRSELKSSRTFFIAPSVLSGNTDTQSYWALSKNIFRYTHFFAVGPDNIHTINEACDAAAFVELIGFFVTLILNADEAIL